MADDDNVVMVTWANWHYADFVRNWVEHVQSAGITSFLVGLQDLSLLCKLAAWTVACVLWVLLCLCPCPLLTGRIMAARTSRMRTMHYRQRCTIPKLW